MPSLRAPDVRPAHPDYALREKSPVTDADRMQSVLDALPLRVSCGVDGCGWSGVEAPAAEARQRAAEHREQAHPELPDAASGMRARKRQKRAADDAARVDANARRATASGGRAKTSPRKGAAAKPKRAPIALAPGRRRALTRGEVLDLFRRFERERGRPPLPSDAAECDYLPKPNGLTARGITWASLWKDLGWGSIPRGRAAQKWKREHDAAPAETAEPVETVEVVEPPARPDPGEVRVEDAYPPEPTVESRRAELLDLERRALALATSLRDLADAVWPEAA